MQSPMKMKSKNWATSFLNFQVNRKDTDFYISVPVTKYLKEEK